MVQKVTTELSFHDGVLCPPGTTINIDPEVTGMTKANSPNLGDVADAPAMRFVPVAPIAPSGPNPVMPQQVPPGSVQTIAGYAAENGTMLVAEGAPVLREQAVVAGDTTAGTTAPVPGSGPTFNPDAIIAGNVPDVVPRLAGLSPEQLKAVQAAEQDRESPRRGVLSAIEELNG